MSTAFQCRGDWLLQFVYRAASVQMIDIAGLEPVQWKDRRMVNVDLTEIVSPEVNNNNNKKQNLVKPCKST